MNAPLPILRSGELTQAAVRTHCPFCAFQCGIRMSVDETGGAAIAPDDDFPVNRGRMCVKGFSAGALLDHPERLRSPLMRRHGQLVPVTWDEVMEHVAQRLRSLRAAHGADSVAAFGSGALTNEKAYLLGKFVRLALGSRMIDYNGRYCMSSAAAGQTRAFGIDRGLPFPVSDIAQAQAVMLWGVNCAETLPPIMQYFEQQRRAGGKLIVVDPRRTETARAAQLHLQLTPGSDLALANGLLHIALDENLIDADFIASRTIGFEGLRRAILSYYPERVERLTGVSVEHMRRAVGLLARSERSMLLTGRGAEQQSKGAANVMACINLMLALGKVGKPASGYGCLTGQGNGQGGREHGQKADQLPGYRRIDDPEDRAAIARAWGVDPASMPGAGVSAVEMIDRIGTAADSIRALLVFGSNLSVASPNARHVDAQLAKLELLVVADSFLNETAAAHAHVVLPVTQWAEEDGTMTNLEGRVILRNRVIDAPADVRSDLEVLCDLARRLGAGRHFPSDDPQTVFDELARVTAGARADYSGITWDRIRDNDGVYWPCPSADHPGTPRLFADRFAHADGKARFHLVEHEPPAELPDAEFPLYFTSGRYREHYNTGAQTRRVDALIEPKPAPRLQIHPTLAARLGIADGAPVRVESRRGAVVFAAEVTSDIRCDTVFAPFHYGGRQAANILTHSVIDPISKMPEFKICAVRIVKAGI